VTDHFACQAVRAQRRPKTDAQRIANHYQTARGFQAARANVLDDRPVLKSSAWVHGRPLASKNIDCRSIYERCHSHGLRQNDLSVDYRALTTVSPIPPTGDYQAQTACLHHYSRPPGPHWRLPHIVPKLPAPIYGSRFTIGPCRRNLRELPATDARWLFELKTVVMNGIPMSA